MLKVGDWTHYGLPPDEQDRAEMETVVWRRGNERVHFEMRDAPEELRAVNDWWSDEKRIETMIKPDIKHFIAMLDDESGTIQPNGYLALCRLRAGLDQRLSKIFRTLCSRSEMFLRKRLAEEELLDGMIDDARDEMLRYDRGLNRLRTLDCMLEKYEIWGEVEPAKLGDFSKFGSKPLKEYLTIAHQLQGKSNLKNQHQWTTEIGRRCGVTAQAVLRCLRRYKYIKEDEGASNFWEYRERIEKVYQASQRDRDAFQESA